MAPGFEQNDFLGKGWSFPPTFIPTLQGVEMTEKVDDIQRSLQILLTTRVGERIMQPKYGCNMDEMVFESLSTTTKTIMKDKIETAILYFEPRIDVVSISMDTTNELEGEVLIEIEYLVRATNNRFNFVFPYYINEGTELNILTIDKSIGNNNG
jgi:phage baseplate assembly protein W